MNPAVPQVGDTFPALTAHTTDGTEVSMADLADGSPALVYFMRTPTCPVCNQHLKALSRTTIGSRVIVVVPGTISDARYVAERHRDFPGQFVASETAHAEVGLFVKVGLQQSGGFVVDANGVVTYAQYATVPVASLTVARAVEAIEAVGHR